MVQQRPHKKPEQLRPELQESQVSSRTPPRACSALRGRHGQSGPSASSPPRPIFLSRRSRLQSPLHSGQGLGQDWLKGDQRKKWAGSDPGFLVLPTPLHPRLPLKYFQCCSFVLFISVLPGQAFLPPHSGGAFPVTFFRCVLQKSSIKRTLFYEIQHAFKKTNILLIQKRNKYSCWISLCFLLDGQINVQIFDVACPDPRDDDPSCD